ncbi:hypothetical protein HG263_04795 [Pseudoalteromonas sp. JBTF-M23]|uniref:Uncharacterized protein n=1 Tax=Pseudoalteromonas caenipelagi TaxID=2726988 RepID=A0A849V939_9GAMM|nr:hypothetical protein [Pseudoalteromonas caenipelagi]NOU49852.1 hypothetical protein [Pseudoalteromonas caenipelagi]
MTLHSQRENKFVKYFMTSMLVFLLCIGVQVAAFEFFRMATWLQVVVTLLPVIPLLWSFKIFLTRYKALDEYLKSLIGEAFLWVLGVLCFATFTYGMLAMKFELPTFNIALILPIAFGAHGLVLTLLLRKDNEK